MIKLPGKWGGVRRNSGRPRSGVREARRLIQTALIEQGVEGAAHVVTDLILAGRGNEVLKIWCTTISVYDEHLQEKQEQQVQQDILVTALLKPLGIRCSP